MASPVNVPVAPIAIPCHRKTLRTCARREPIASNTAMSFALSVTVIDRTTRMFNPATNVIRSEEHTSELQSRLHLVCRLLLEKKKKKNRCRVIDQHAYNTNTVCSIARDMD